MSCSTKRFLVDTNSILTPYKTYYPFDFAERFWIQLYDKIASGDIIVMDIVRDELRRGEDELTEWINEVDESLILSGNNGQILLQYAEIINYINTARCYSDKALSDWSQASVADPWLIAAGKVYGYTIVTFEKIKCWFVIKLWIRNTLLIKGGIFILLKASERKDTFFIIQIV